MRAAAASTEKRSSAADGARGASAIARARPRQSPGSTSVPAPASTSGIAPLAHAITGVPAACASTSTIPNCSSQPFVGSEASTSAVALA